MNYYDAMRLLDKVREGAQYPIYTINKALELTGDRLGTFEELGGGGVDTPLQEKGERPRDIRGPNLVEQHDCRH